MVKQRACKTRGVLPSLITFEDNGNIKVIKASQNTKCLGGTLQGDLQWRAMLETGGGSPPPIPKEEIGGIEIFREEYPK